MKQLRKAVDEGYILLDLEAHNLEEIFQKALDRLVERNVVAEEDRDQVIAGLLAREQQSSTAIGDSVAIPHLYSGAIREPVILFARLEHPMNLGAPDGVPTRFFFHLLGPKAQPAEHLDHLMNIARLMSEEEFRYDATVAHNREELLDAVDRFLERTTPPAPPPPPEPKIPEELQYTGKLAGGLWRDITRKTKHYISDFTEGFHSKSVSSIFFLVFACLAPAVTFGGFMSYETNNDIGTVEMLVASAICGVVFALLSGQPLIILGGTGPLLIITAILFQLCETLSIEFLPTYGWVGLWTMVFLIILAVTDSSCWMRYFTRFTDEIFAALISLIFITEAIKPVLEVIAEDYGKPHASHDKSLLTLLLAAGTYIIAMNLSRFRQSRYLRPRIREFLADFGPTIALASMTLVAVIFHVVEPATLDVPKEFGTTSGRPWTINLWDVPQWVWFASAIPAVLVTILVYLDQNITSRLVNSPDHNLRKGGGYHLDLAIVGGLIGFCSCFGLPWLVAATVRSLNHVRSLATTEEVITPSGQARERVIHVRENRVTALAIHLLIGVSLLLLLLLRQIPMAVLYGLFLYMGVVSMKGNQFFERLSLWVMDTALYPTTHYLRKVPTWVVH